MGRRGRCRGALSTWPAPPDVSSSTLDSLAPHEESSGSRTRGVLGRRRAL